MKAAEVWGTHCVVGSRSTPVRRLAGRGGGAPRSGDGGLGPRAWALPAPGPAEAASASPRLRPRPADAPAAHTRPGADSLGSGLWPPDGSCLWPLGTHIPTALYYWPCPLRRLWPTPLGTAGWVPGQLRSHRGGVNRVPRTGWRRRAGLLRPRQPQPPGASLVRAAQNGSSGKCSQPQATPAASWGRGAGWLVDPCQACGTSAQDSVTHLLAKPSSEARQAQTRRHWPRGLDESLQEGSSSMPCKDRQLRGGGRALGAEHGEGHPAVLWDPVGSCGTQTRDSHLCWDQNKNVKSSEQV